jgi:predicted house-cleaning noncanonical NTP pyrophosphatase (MazG superfamily)
MIFLISFKRNSKFHMNLLQVTKKRINYFTIIKSSKSNISTFYGIPKSSRIIEILALRSKTNVYLNSVVLSLISSSILASIGYLLLQNKLSNAKSLATNEQSLASELYEYKTKSIVYNPIYYKLAQDDVFKQDISSKLVNTEPKYIETKNVENLFPSFPRFQNALMYIKCANKYPTQANYQRVFDELLKLSESNYSNSSKLEELIRLKIIKNFDFNETANQAMMSQNPFINDSLADYLSLILR